MKKVSKKIRMLRKQTNKSLNKYLKCIINLLFG